MLCPRVFFFSGMSSVIADVLILFLATSGVFHLPYWFADAEDYLSFLDPGFFR